MKYWSDGVLDKLLNALNDVLAAFQIAKLYGQEHQRFLLYLDKAYQSLQEFLREREELVVGFVGEEWAWEKEILFEFSKRLKLTTAYLKARGIEKITFLQEISKEELYKFIALLLMTPDQINHNPEEQLVIMGVRNVVIGKLGMPSAEALQDQIEKGLNQTGMYQDSLDVVSQTMESVLDGKNLDYLSLRFAMTNIIENILAKYQEFITLATVKKYDMRTFIHILNVSILSMFFSSKLGFAKNDTADIGVAALFHDLGKLYISRKIIAKPDKLTEEEFSAIRNHVVVGAEILLKYVDTLGVLPVIVCFEHHLKYNLKGYPKLEFYQQQHLGSQVVAICDVYDALTQRRSYKSDYPPKMIYEIMQKEKGTSFQPELLDAFFRIVGVWPVGTIVRLDNGWVAVVRVQNEDAIFSPQVEVVSPLEARGTVDLKSEQNIHIDHFLNPLTEGKDFVQFVRK